MRRFIGLVLTIGGGSFAYWQSRIVEQAMRGYIDSRVSAGAYQYLGINPNSVAAHHQSRIDTAEALMVFGVLITIVGFIMVIIPTKKPPVPGKSSTEIEA